MKIEKKITHEEYARAMQEKERLEKYLEHLNKITRAYVYQWEAERVETRKKENRG